MKKIIAILIVFTLMCSFNIIGCSNKKKVLSIGYVEAGYGNQWLKDYAKEFLEENKDINLEIQFNGSGEYTDYSKTQLDTDKITDDIMFCFKTNWQQFAAQGKLECLDSVYASESDGQTIESRLVNSYKDYGKMNGKDGIERYYAMPWNDGITGIVYNSKMFAYYGWDIPKTVDDLSELCNKIKSDSIANKYKPEEVNKYTDEELKTEEVRNSIKEANSNETSVMPFVYPGKYLSYWDYLVNSWWAQYETENGFKTFFEFENRNVYAQQGRLKALEAFENLNLEKSGEENGIVKRNAITGSLEKDHIQSQMVFASGVVAMIPNGSWIQSELEKSLPDGFEMKMMSTPKLLKDKNGNAVEDNYNWTATGDYIVIPKKSKNVDIAKKFLVFMHQPKQLRRYTELTNTPRPFSYDRSDLIENMSPFGKSINELYNNSINLYDTSPSLLYKMEFLSKWPASVNIPYTAILNDGKSAKDVFDLEVNNMSEKEWQKITAKAN